MAQNGQNIVFPEAFIFWQTAADGSNHDVDGKKFIFQHVYLFSKAREKYLADEKKHSFCSTNQQICSKIWLCHIIHGFMQL